MIKLTAPLNYGGVIIEEGTNVGFLPMELQEKLLKSGGAERIEPEAEVKGSAVLLDEMTKAELLEHATSLQIEGLSDKMTKPEIIARIEEYGKV